MITGWKFFDELPDNLKHLIVLFVFGVISLPIAINYLGREEGNILIIVAGGAIALGKELYDEYQHRKGLKPVGWDYFDFFFSIAGLWLGIIVGGGFIAKEIMGI